MNISVSITHYNISHFLENALKIIKDDERISEIIITDDCSNLQEYQNAKEIVGTINNPKIKLIRNDVNLGNYMNKLKSLKIMFK